MLFPYLKVCLSALRNTIGGKQMNGKIGMRAFSVLLTVLLVSVVMPAVSAQSLEIESGSECDMEDEKLVKIANISLPIMGSKTYSVDSAKYDRPMTKEEFQETNAGYIKFLREQFGDDKAQQIIDDAYAAATTKAMRSDATIVRVGLYDMYLWPHLNTVPNTSKDAGINAIFLGKTVDEMASIIKGNGWGSALGLTEWGLHGLNLNNMVWTNSPGSNPLGNHQLEDGSALGDRYHLVMIDGHYSSSIGDDWCYGNCHYEYWSWDDWDHFLYPDSSNVGRDHLYNALSDDASASWIYLENPSGIFNGWGYLFDMD
ncbi:MAG: hypothetical protein PWR21_1317 [Methanoculleus sp.]|nr:hypothetical protein [Methanoculleus sp.]